jgi:hypothetical protein
MSPDVPEASLLAHEMYGRAAVTALTFDAKMLIAEAKTMTVGVGAGMRISLATRNAGRTVAVGQAQ